MPRSSSRSYMRRGSIAVARSSTFSDGEPQKASMATRRRRRSGTDIRSALGTRSVAADAPELVAHDRPVLEPVAVGVDDRVLQARAELPRLSRSVDGHRRTPPGQAG